MNHNRLCLYLIFTISVIPGFSFIEQSNPSLLQSLNNLCHEPLPPINSKSMPADPSLRYVFGIFRHGIRASLGIPSPADEDISRPSVGKLTKVGKRQLYNVGKVLRKRYERFLSEYDEDKVTVTSTAKKRNIMSALSLMAGMFPPSDELFSDLRWQPIPIESNTVNFDKSYLYGYNHPGRVLKKCPSFEKYVRPGWEINLSPDSRPYYTKLYEFLQSHTGEINMTSINSVIIFSDTIDCMCLHGVQPEQWLLKPRPEYQNKRIYPDLMKPIALEWFKNVQYYENNREMLNYIAGPMINQIQVHFKEVLQKNSLKKMSFHMTHDSILNPLFWYMNTTKSINFYPGDGVLFELHVMNNHTFIKVFHYDAIQGHVLTELQLLSCPSPCSYEEFTLRFKGITPEQWMEKCKL